MNSRNLSTRAYVSAAFFVALAFAIRLALGPLIQERSPFLLFVLAVLASAVMHGRGPALLAVALSTVAGLWAFIEPHYELKLVAVDAATNLAAFLATCIGVMILTERLRHAQAAELIAQAKAQVGALRYEALINSIEAGFSLVELQFDEAGRAKDFVFIEVNPSFERQVGLVDAQGKSVRQLLPALEEHWFETYGRVALTGDSIRFESGSEALGRWFDVYAVPMSGTKPHEVGVLFNDITARRQAEEQVKQLNRDLEKLVEERTRRLEQTVDDLDAFAYTVSHDLRAPLRGIEGFARILRDEHAEQLGERGRAYATRIYMAAERMDQLIQDLLAYSRLSRVDLDLKTVELETVIDQVLADHAAMISAEQATVVVERPMPAVRGARAVLIQIVANLLTNALKFVPRGRKPHVILRTQTRGERVCLYVEDEGIGIEDEFRSRIFNVFERLHGQEHYTGTGIGLAIVRKAAERLGGAAGVDPRDGGGSRFWVELAAGKADRPERKPQ